MYPQFGPNLCLQLVNGFLELVIYLLWGFSLSSSLCRSLFISFPWHAISLSFFIPWMQHLSFSVFLGWGKARICHLLGNDKGGQPNVSPVILPEPKPTWWVCWGNSCSHHLYCPWSSLPSLSPTITQVHSRSAFCTKHVGCTACNSSSIILNSDRLCYCMFFFSAKGNYVKCFLGCGSFMFSRTLSFGFPLR